MHGCTLYSSLATRAITMVAEELQRALTDGRSLIAVVDPPRAGLHNDCLR